MELKNILNVKTGINSSRMKPGETVEAYTAADLEDDLLNMTSTNHFNKNGSTDISKKETYNGELIQSLISERTAIVTENNVGKSINQNFAYFEFDETKLDPKFLCYMLNESEEIKRQRYRLSQGTIVRKASPRTIMEFDIKIPSIEIQQAVGNLYGLILAKRRVTLAKIKIDEQIVLERIKQTMKNNV